MSKFLPFGRRMRAVDAHAIFDEHFKEYGKEATRREKDITPMDIQLGRDSVWVEKVIRHLMFSLDIGAEVGPPLISPEMAEDMFWADLESALGRVHGLLDAVGINMTTVKGDGIFVFNECENVLQDVECRALQARVW